jgi:hypothetical protein
MLLFRMRAWRRDDIAGKRGGEYERRRRLAQDGFLVLRSSDRGRRVSSPCRQGVLVVFRTSVLEPDSVAGSPFGAGGPFCENSTETWRQPM